VATASTVRLRCSASSRVLRSPTATPPSTPSW
jgi:hypothetical protein